MGIAVETLTAHKISGLQYETGSVSLEIPMSNSSKTVAYNSLAIKEM